MNCSHSSTVWFLNGHTILIVYNVCKIEYVHYQDLSMFIFRLVCFFILPPPQIYRRHHCRWNVDLCSALMVTEQWGFYSETHIVWAGHLFVMVITEHPWPLRNFAKRLTVELSLFALTTYVCRGWDSNTETFSMRGLRSKALRHRRLTI